MLKIDIPKREFFNEEIEEFLYTEACTLELEHSLYSVRLWEQKHKKPWMTDEPKTYAETIDYVRCMTLNTEIDPLVYKCLTSSDMQKITDYIQDSMTATTFSDNGFKENKGRKKEIITAEIIYYYMVALNIPFEAQYWHLNQLMTLIKVVNIKQSPPKKHSKRDILSRNARLNAERRKRLGSKG